MVEADSQLPHLETFCWAAEQSSFTAAAEALGITQAAVSQRIQALEKELGVPLFQRRGGRVLLTDAGRKLHGFALKILSLHCQARESITGSATPITGELVLAASTIPGEHLMPGLLTDFCQTYPEIRVRASETDSLGVVEAVEQGKVQLGLAGRKSDNQNLEFQPFAMDEMVLVVPRDHAWARRRRVSVDQLKHEPLVVREPGSGSRWCLEQALAQRGMTLADLRIALELGSNEAIKEAVAKGAGVAVLSALAVQRELDAKVLHGLKIDDLALDRMMFVVWDKRRVLPPPARLLLTFISARSPTGDSLIERSQ